MTLFNFSVFYKNMLAVFKRKQLLALKKKVYSGLGFRNKYFRGRT